jgi:predicted transcriptional regulator
MTTEKKVLEYLSEKPMTVREISFISGLQIITVRKAIQRLLGAGKVCVKSGGKQLTGRDAVYETLVTEDASPRWTFRALLNAWR